MSERDTQESQLAVRLPWQTSQWIRFEDLYRDQRLPHAFVLSGAQGIGKLRFALALAHYLMCEHPVSGTACGECRQCGFNRAATHPDLKLVTREERGRQIKVDQIRDLVGFLGHTAQQGGYKVAIIQPAEAMNNNAANALLKSLEEPAGKTLLLLITDAPSRLLATIRSRCQNVAFPLPPWQQALDWLVGTMGGAAQVPELLTEARGRPMAALELFQSGGLSRFQQLDTDFLALLVGGEDALSLVEKWQEFEMTDILMRLSQRISSLIGWSVAGVPLPDRWVGLAQKAESTALYVLLDRIDKLHLQIRQGANPNRQLALEDLLLGSCDKFHT